MQSLATETFKIKNEMSPKMCPKPAQFPWNSFCQYCTQWNGSISYLGPKILNIVPDEIKQKSSLSSFKESI